MSGIMRMSKEEWLAKGKRLFGKDLMKWEFVCPGCGHVQKIEDFRPYKDKGANPNSAYQECIGRYTAGESWAFGGKSGKRTPGEPCDYAGYGLIRISPIVVISEDGSETNCFAFNEGKDTIKI